jgi:hypothetical protein
MNAKIHVAPYVRGPAVANVDSQPSRETKASRNGLRGFSAGLLPHRLIEKSESLFAVQIVLLAVAVGTLFAWFLGASSTSLVVALAVVGLLASGLFVGHAIRAWLDARQPSARPHTTSPSPKPEIEWAYRATNYRQIRAAGMPRATEATAVAISTQLVLEAVEPDRLRAGDIVVIEARQIVPADGTILEGMAVVDESAITGQSAPVIRHEGGVKEVMRDSRVIEGQLFIEVTPRRGHPLDWIGGVVLTRPRTAEPAGQW